MYIYYNSTNTCDICRNKLIPGKTRREYNKKAWTGRWLCYHCYCEIERDKTRHIALSRFKSLKCCICGIDISSRNCYRTRYYKEKEILTERWHSKGNWKGNWLCNSCYRKNKADIRNNSIDPNSPTGKGNFFEQITCKWRGVDNLNIKNNDYHSPIDHSRDSEFGIIQTKGAVFNSTYGTWEFAVKNEHEKIFDNIICYCSDEKMERIERIYIFPRYEIIKRKTVTITKNPSKGVQWYEKYRIDERMYESINIFSKV